MDDSFEHRLGTVKKEYLEPYESIKEEITLNKDEITLKANKEDKRPN
jgi:hypothetical protein